MVARPVTPVRATERGPNNPESTRQPPVRRLPKASGSVLSDKTIREHTTMRITYPRQKAKGRRQNSRAAICDRRPILATLVASIALTIAMPSAGQDDTRVEAVDDAQAAADLELISALERVVSRAIGRAE